MNPIMNNKVYLGSKHRNNTHRRRQPRPKTAPYNYTRGTVMGTPMEWWMDETLCGSVDDARRYAERLMPEVNLRYIPRSERRPENWIDDKVYLDPRQGRLTWCHSGVPKTAEELGQTKMYVVDDQVGATVDAVVKGAKRERHRIAQVDIWEKAKLLLKGWVEAPPSSFWGMLETVTAEEMYTMIHAKTATSVDFVNWLAVRPPEEPQTKDLNASMDSLVVSAPVDNNAAEPKTYDSGYETNAEEKECDAALTTRLEEALTEDLPGLTTVPQEGQRVEELEEFI